MERGGETQEVVGSTSGMLTEGFIGEMLHWVIQKSGVFLGMEFHEELHNLGTKEGLKGRKLSKAIESFAWNITVLKVSTETTPLRLPLANLCSFSSSICTALLILKQYFALVGCINYPILLRFAQYI